MADVKFSALSAMSALGGTEKLVGLQSGVALITTLAPKIPHDAVIVVDPHGCSTDFTGIKFYRDGSLIATQTQGYFDDSANVLPGVQYSYTTKVTTLTHGDSAASAPTLFRLPATRGFRL